MSRQVSDSTREQPISEGWKRRIFGGDKGNHPHLRLVVFWVVGVTACLILMIAIQGLFRNVDNNPTSLQLSGRIEGDETHIGTRLPARVNEVLVREGDHVLKGQLILKLDDQDVKAKFQEAQSGVKMAQTMEQQARIKVNALRSGLVQAEEKKPGIVGRLFGAKKKIEAERSKLTTELDVAKAQLNEAGAGVSKASASREEVNSNLSYFNITSPIDGVCTISNAQPGDLVAPGQVLISLVDLNSLYLKAFIPEAQLGQVRIGQDAKVILDSFPKTPLKARVISIDEHAAFTPENVYFKQDRVKQVFGVKLAIENPGGIAMPGMTADGEIVPGGRKEPAR